MLRDWLMTPILAFDLLKTRHTRHQKPSQERSLLCLQLLTVIEVNKVYAVKGKTKDTVYMVEQSDTVPHCKDVMEYTQCSDTS